MNKLKLAPYYILLFLGCKANKVNMGHIVMKDYFVDSVTHKSERFNSDGHHFWFRDSSVVAENIVTNYKDSSGFVRQWDEVYNYVFFDFRERHFYEYLHFADTAVLQVAYKEPDDLRHRLTLRMYKDWPNPAYADSILKNGKNLADTTINNKSYSRFRFEEYRKKANFPKIKFIITLYLDCQSKTTIKFFKWFSESRGCPVVRYDEQFDGNFVYFELNTIKKTFTSQEKKAFDIWEKYAKEHPVK